jgi:hypothetical protein
MKFIKTLFILGLIQSTFVFCHRIHNQEDAKVSTVTVNSIDQVFEKLNNMIMDKVPEHASFVYVDSKVPLPDGKYWTPEYLGWIIGEDSLYYTFLDCSAQKVKIEKKYSSVSPASLKEESKKAINYEGIFGDRWRPVRRHALSEITPLYVMSLWCYNNKLKDEAIAIINERSNDFTELLNRLSFIFGSLYYNEMLHSYSQERDYKKAILFSDHLSKPEFNDFEYRSDAILLGDQLRKRGDDFVILKLPSENEWNSLKSTLSRGKQIKYLCKRLKLLNCIQIYQPGGISYRDIQYSVPSSTFAKSVQVLSNWPVYEEGEVPKEYEVINPFNELLKMKLEPSDIKLVAPYLADQDYIVSYSFHRDFKNERYLHTVNDVVSEIILSSIGRKFVDMKSFNSLDNRSKRKEIRKIIRWCNKNDVVTEEELALRTLKNTHEWPEFATTMNKCLERRYTKAIPTLIKRINDFEVAFQPLIKDKIAETIFNFGPDESITIEKLRELEANSDYWVKRWASLYIIKYRDQYFAEGLSNLKIVLDSCNGTTWYPSSIEILLGSKQEEAHKLADRILDKPGFLQDFDRPYNNEQIKSLFLSGSQKAYSFMVKGLNDMRTDSTHSMGSNELLFCDRYMTLVNDWKGIDDDDHYLKSTKEHGLISKKMTAWLEEQFRLIKSGKEPGIKHKKVNEPEWRLDAPGF